MSEMNNIPPLQELFSIYRKELGYSFVACLIAVAKHWQRRDPFREIVTNGVICAAVAFGISNVLDFFNIDSGKWGYMASIFLGYVGVEVMLDLLAERIPFLKSINRKGGDDVPPK